MMLEDALLDYMGMLRRAEARYLRQLQEPLHPEKREQAEYLLEQNRIRIAIVHFAMLSDRFADLDAAVAQAIDGHSAARH